MSFILGRFNFRRVLVERAEDGDSWGLEFRRQVWVLRRQPERILVEHCPPDPAGEGLLCRGRTRTGPVDYRKGGGRGWRDGHTDVAGGGWAVWKPRTHTSNGRKFKCNVFSNNLCGVNSVLILTTQS